MAELTQENSSLRTQLDSVQNVSTGHVTGDTELAGKVDKNANLQMAHTSDEPSASDADHRENSGADERQVVTLFWLLQCQTLCAYQSFVIYELFTSNVDSPAFQVVWYFLCQICVFSVAAGQVP